MKKIILLVFCISTSTLIFAQSTEWGVRTGANLASQTTDVFSDKVRPGIYAGLFAEHRFNRFLGVQCELLYSMMGGRISYGVSGNYYGPYGYGDGTEVTHTDVTATDKTNYIVLPVLTKFYVLKNLSFDLGPQFGYMISAKERIEAEGLNENTSINYDYTSNYYNRVDRKFDVSLGVGFSYRLNRRFDISARGNFGLTNISDNSKMKNNVMQLGVGYRLK